MGLYASELRKAITHPIGASSAAGAIVCIPVVAAAISNQGIDGSTSLLRALQVGQIFTVLLAMGAVGQEFEGSSLRTSLLATPQRGRLLLVKFAALATIVTGVVFAAGAFGSLALAFSSDSPGLPGFQTSVLATASWIGISFVAAAIAISLRSVAAPGVILIPMILGISQIFLAFLPGARFLPDQATYEVFITDANAKGTLAPGMGMLVLCAWLVALLIPAGYLFRSRDV